MRTSCSSLAFLVCTLCAMPVVAGSESDTSVSKVRLKLRSNRYEVNSIRLEDKHPSLTIATLHERVFKLRAGQTLEVYLDDTNPLLFQYPDSQCAIQKFPTANDKVIKGIEAAINGSANSSDATSSPESDTLESEDRTASRATRGACSENNPRVIPLKRSCESIPRFLKEFKLQTLPQLDDDGLKDLKAHGIKDANEFLSNLTATVKQLGGHATCVPQLTGETAANLPCVKTVVDDWGDPKALEDKAQQLSEGARAVLSEFTPQELGADVEILRDAANLPSQAKIVADFLRVLPKVGQPIKVATFSYDRANNQSCTLEIKPNLPAGVGASAASYYWHGTTRVTVIPQ